MRKFRHSFLVNAGIDRVWEFYTDIGHLEVITPPKMQLKVLKATSGRRLAEGAEVWLTGKLVTRSNWHSRITALAPYEYVDEMLSGRFKKWRHVHAFRPAAGVSGSGGSSAAGATATEVIDEIEFELHYGIIGRMFEGYVYNQLQKIFAHRKAATIAALEK